MGYVPAIAAARDNPLDATVTISSTFCFFAAGGFCDDDTCQTRLLGCGVINGNIFDVNAIEDGSKFVCHDVEKQNSWRRYTRWLLTIEPTQPQASKQVARLRIRNAFIYLD